MTEYSRLLLFIVYSIAAIIVLAVIGHHMADYQEGERECIEGVFHVQVGGANYMQPSYICGYRLMYRMVGDVDPEWKIYRLYREEDSVEGGEGVH